jgi:hypothetical protein
MLNSNKLFGRVPAPSSGASAFLREDGTWVTFDEAMTLHKYQKGKLQNKTQLILRLGSNAFVDVTEFAPLKESNRAFSIYRWRDDITLSDEVYSGYQPWIYYSACKWHKYEHHSPKETEIGHAAMSGHNHFKTLDDFKDWLGEAEWSKLVADLV